MWEINSPTACTPTCLPDQEVASEFCADSAQGVKLFRAECGVCALHQGNRPVGLGAVLHSRLTTTSDLSDSAYEPSLL
jgi:hypothetical protein